MKTPGAFGFFIMTFILYIVEDLVDCKYALPKFWTVLDSVDLQNAWKRAHIIFLP
jgi:hypothetical protein